MKVEIRDIFTKMGLNSNVFQEPRGVMRIIQFIFAICAFATTVNFTNQLLLHYCEDGANVQNIEIEYPFELDKMSLTLAGCGNGSAAFDFRLPGDFSSDSQFFVATGVLSMLYCIGISVVYLMFDAAYQSNALIPMADFMLTVLLAVFWLSGSAAWANGLDGLKSVLTKSNLQLIRTPPDWPKIFQECSVGSWSGLTISVILGFLNFFLWASDLWFLYKETQWFKNTSPTAAPTSPGIK